MVLVVVWSIGQLFRDATWLTGLCFYLPSPLLAFALPVAAIWARGRRTLVLLLAIPPLLFTLAVENQFGRSAANPPERELRLIHWNVGLADFGSEHLHGVLEDLRGDAYVFSEAPGDTELWAEEHIDSTVRFRSMLVTARGELRLVEPLPLTRGLAALMEWTLDGRTLTLLITDLPSSILVARDPLLAELNALIRKHRPDLVVGDFNAPRRSRRLADLPEGYVHAYDAAGSGWSYTWPVPCPMWAIDQCIAGPRVAPVRYELRSSRHSDHRLQCFDFAVHE